MNHDHPPHKTGTTAHERHEPPTIKTKPWPPTNETTHNPQKPTSDEERSLQPPTNNNKKRARPHMKNKEPPSLAPTNNSTKRARATTTAHLLQPPTNDDRPPRHETGMTTNDDNCMPSKPTNDEERPAQPLTNNDCPSHKACTTCQRHGTSTPITHTGVHALPPVTIPLTFQSSQGCMAVSIDTCTALARFIGHVWSHKPMWVGIPVGFCKPLTRTCKNPCLWTWYGF